jgi:cytoskeletal protein CcmA (bactofilin family)
MTFIGRGLTITGTIESSEPLRIAGAVNGAVLAADTDVCLDPTARVRGPVTGRTIVVRGTFAGRLIAKELVRIEATARVRANVASPRFSLADGARFRGAVEPGRTDAALIVLEYRTRTEARRARLAAEVEGDRRPIPIAKP